MTPDELTIAWVRKTSDRLQLWYADRESTSVGFETLRALSPAVGFESPAHAALSADGLRLVLVRDDGRGFGELRRLNRKDTFAGTPDAAPFAYLAELAQDEVLADPVLAADDATLFFSRVGRAAGSTLWVASRSAKQGGWLPGVVVEAANFVPVGSKLRRPTGVSIDRRALFYYDESVDKSGIAYRPAVGEPFSRFVEVGPRRSVLPSASCLRLYFSASTLDGFRIFSMVSG